MEQTNNQTSSNVSGVGRLGNNVYINKTSLSENRSQKTKRIIWVWIISISALVLSLISIVFLNHSPHDLTMLATTLIIALLGGLATFVVVSNFSQVNNIEKKIEQRLDFIDGVALQLNNLEKDIERIKEQIKNQSTNIENNRYPFLESSTKIQKFIESTVPKAIRDMDKLRDKIKELNSSVLTRSQNSNKNSKK
jgi:hypothetical protein